MHASKNLTICSQLSWRGVEKMLLYSTPAHAKMEDIALFAFHTSHKARKKSHMFSNALSIHSLSFMREMQHIIIIHGHNKNVRFVQWADGFNTNIFNLCKLFWFSLFFFSCLAMTFRFILFIFVSDEAHRFCETNLSKKLNNIHIRAKWFHVST